MVSKFKKIITVEDAAIQGDTVVNLHRAGGNADRGGGLGGAAAGEEDGEEERAGKARWSAHVSK